MPVMCCGSGALYLDARADSWLASATLPERAYDEGPLAAAQPGTTLVDPLIATTWSILVVGERARTGALLPLGVLPAKGPAP